MCLYLYIQIYFTVHVINPVDIISNGRLLLIDQLLLAE